jgi:diaminobutyrate-2-oxoglutarate transaminase
MSNGSGVTSMPETRESAVRSYSRSFPAVFTTAQGDFISAQDGSHYIDFLAGAGSMNYGHNPAAIKRILIDYLENDGLTNGLDLATAAKQDFLDVFGRHILEPRSLRYKVQFCSPSGTNAVEAALKIARIATGRINVVSFSGGFHGVSTGSLAVTGSHHHKQRLYHSLPQTTHVPYPDSPYGRFDSLDLLRRLVEDPSSGTEKPAAVVLETIQCEGGVYIAPTEFLIALRHWCDQHGILLIADDIQVGCGRAGSFFSFERADIKPDLVTLSKSISAYGLPMSLLLIKPEYDIWQPGQHNGTFRGNQLAFVAAAAAIRAFWADGVDGAFAADVRRKGTLVSSYLERHIPGLGAKVRGMGLIWGIDLQGTDISATKASAMCFDRGLIVETCGRDSTVIKLLPPLTVDESILTEGLGILTGVLNELASSVPEPPATQGAHP